MKNNSQPAKPTMIETQFSLLDQRFTSFEDEVEHKFNAVEHSIASLRNEIRDWMRDRQPHYYRYATVAIAIVGVIWWIITAQINNISRANEKDYVALTETARQNSRINETQTQNIADLVKAVAADHSVRLANEREIETQLRALESYANLTRVYDNRLFGLLWEKTYNQQIPDVQFYPGIADGGVKGFAE